MPTTLDQVAEYTHRLDLKFNRDDERSAILMGMGAPNGAINLFIAVQGEGNSLGILAPYVDTLPATDARAPECLKAFLMIHYRILLGTYEYDASDGEVRFRISMPLDNAPLSLEQYSRCIGALVTTVDTFRPLTAMIRWGGLTAEQAIAACEKQAAERVARAQEGEEEFAV